MDAFGFSFLIVFLLVVFLLAVFLVFRVQGGLRSHKAKRRSKRAMESESLAETLLIDAGYSILERQKSFKHQVWVDGEPVEFLLRFDYVVCKDHRTFLAEVKSGDFAPSIHTAATRRQLLEYATACGHQEILLVDAFEDSIQVIRFDTPKQDVWINDMFDFSKTIFNETENEEYWTLF